MRRHRDMEPEEAAAFIESEEDVRLLDVREPAEFQTAKIDGAVLATPQVVRDLLDNCPRHTPIVVYCHHGMRSLVFTFRLLQGGFTNVINLKGGIEEWSQRVDPTVPRYEIRYGSGIVVVRE